LAFFFALLNAKATIIQIITIPTPTVTPTPIRHFIVSDFFSSSVGGGLAATIASEAVEGVGGVADVEGAAVVLMMFIKIQYILFSNYKC